MQVSTMSGATKSRLAFILVLFSLVSLGVLPLIVQSRVEVLREEANQIGAPVRDALMDFQVALAWESTALRGFLLTGDESFQRTSEKARAERVDAYERLVPLARRLDPYAVEEVRRMDVILREADTVMSRLFDGEISRREYYAELQAQQARFEDLTAVVAALDRYTSQRIAADTATIRETDRTGNAIAAVLIGIAIIAAFVVGSLGRSCRILARDLATALDERAQLLEELQESEGRFRQIADNLEQVIWLGDLNFTQQYYVNPAYEKMWGRSCETLYDNPKSFIEAVHPEDQNRVKDLLFFGRGGGYHVEYRIFRPDGEMRWISSRGYAIHNERGEAYRLAGVIKDVTERKEAEKIRAGLIRGFSHDVKNPLGAADGFLQSMLMGAMGPLATEQRATIKKIRFAIRAAIELIEDLLKVERVASGSVELNITAVDLIALVTAVAEEFRGHAAAAGLEIRAELPSRFPMMQTDPKRLRQILGNLLSNAIKYTASGHIEVRLEQQSLNDEAWAVMEVSDTGPGIAREQQARLFDEFHRVPSQQDKRGSGVGLAFSQRLAKALGGYISFLSEEGKGSTFALWVPLAFSSERSGSSSASLAQED